MKIIINQPRASYFVGGAEIISFEHAINFSKLNNKVYFITLSPKSIGQNYSSQFLKFKKEFKNKIHIVEINQDEKTKYIYNINPGEDRCRWNVESIYYNKKLYEFLSLKKEKYDVLFSYYNLDAVLIPNNLIRKNILYLCGIPKSQNDFQGSFLHAYDKIIAISEEVKELWKKYARDGINVVSTGVDCNRFSLKKYRKETNEINLLYVGRLIKRKNIDSIIYAFETLQKKYNLKLTIVGDGPDRERLEKISKKSIFTGVISNTEEYYKNSDIFITPSKSGEGLQGTILEAMSSGLTIVATNSKINRKLLDDKRGVLINSNINSLIKGIEDAIQFDKIKTGKKCRKYILNNYSWKIKIKELLEELK